MVGTKKDTTEEKILKAAQDVFVQKGMDGARMQEIADKAGINKALLHYYFWTKERLFHAIFKKVLSKIAPDMMGMVRSDLAIAGKIGDFIDKYIDLMMENPFLPSFMLKEINRDPGFLASIIKNTGVDYPQIAGMFQKEMDEGRIRKMSPHDLFVDILSLCIYPIAAKPLLSAILFGNDIKAYSDFISKRKETVKSFVLNSILI